MPHSHDADLGRRAAERAAPEAARAAQRRTDELLCKSYSTVFSMYGPEPGPPRTDVDYCKTLDMTAPQLKCVAQQVLAHDFHGHPETLDVETCRRVCAPGEVYSETGKCTKRPWDDFVSCAAEKAGGACPGGADPSPWVGEHCASTCRAER